MKLGLQVHCFDYEKDIAAVLKEIATTADEGGLASLWVVDHFFGLDWRGPAELNVLEAYNTLGYLAGVTRNIKLGALVTGVIYRYPGILVKTVSTLDVLSGGRSYFGIGAAWYEREALGLGVPFPSVKVRFEQLEETLQIAKQMWSENNGAYEGKHFQLRETLNNPQPLAKPHPPIMIGGSGEKKTLRLVAQYANASNLYPDGDTDTDEIIHKLDVLKRHCEDVGRDYDEIERTTVGEVDLNPGGQTPEQVIALCRELADVGIQHFIVSIANVHEIKPLETFIKEVLPAVAEF